MLNDIRLVAWIIGAIALLALLWDGLKRHHESRQWLEKRKERELAEQQEKQEQVATENVAVMDEEPAAICSPQDQETLQLPLKEENLSNEPSDVPVEGQPEIVQELTPEEMVIDTPPEQEETALEPILFTLKAPEGHSFAGFRLLHVLLKMGFHFNSEQHWFDYHENNDKQGPVLFSLVAATKTGQFDLANMASFSCKGLIIFFEGAAVLEPVKSLDTMIILAEELADELSADLFINEDQVWDSEQLEKLRHTLLK